MTMKVILFLSALWYLACLVWARINAEGWTQEDGVDQKKVQKVSLLLPGPRISGVVLLVALIIYFL